MPAEVLKQLDTSLQERNLYSGPLYTEVVYIKSLRAIQVILLTSFHPEITIVLPLLLHRRFIQSEQDRI